MRLKDGMYLSEGKCTRRLASEWLESKDERAFTESNLKESALEKSVLNESTLDESAEEENAMEESTLEESAPKLAPVK